MFISNIVEILLFSTTGFFFTTQTPLNVRHYMNLSIFLELPRLVNAQEFPLE